VKFSEGSRVEKGSVLASQTRIGQRKRMESKSSNTIAYDPMSVFQGLLSNLSSADQSSIKKVVEHALAHAEDFAKPILDTILNRMDKATSLHKRNLICVVDNLLDGETRYRTLLVRSAHKFILRSGDNVSVLKTLVKRWKTCGYFKEKSIRNMEKQLNMMEPSIQRSDSGGSNHFAKRKSKHNGPLISETEKQAKARMDRDWKQMKIARIESYLRPKNDKFEQEFEEHWNEILCTNLSDREFWKMWTSNKGQSWRPGFEITNEGIKEYERNGNKKESF